MAGADLLRPIHPVHGAVVLPAIHQVRKRDHQLSAGNCTGCRNRTAEVEFIVITPFVAMSIRVIVTPVEWISGNVDA